jgi:hypothetical protein
MKIAKKPNNIDKERKAKIGKRRAKVNRKARYMKPFFPFSGVSVSFSISSSLTSITTAMLYYTILYYYQYTQIAGIWVKKPVTRIINPVIGDSGVRGFSFICVEKEEEI